MSPGAWKQASSCSSGGHALSRGAPCSGCGPHPPCRHPLSLFLRAQEAWFPGWNSLRPTAVAVPALCPKPVCLFRGSERDPPYEILISSGRCRRPSSHWLLTRSPWMACWTTRPFLPRVPTFSENDQMTEVPDVLIENS